MNVIKEIERGINNCNYLLEKDIANAKEHKLYYSDEVDVLIKANKKFMDVKSRELEEWCNASVIAWNIPQNNIILRIKRKILIAVANNYISKISYEMSRSGKAQEELEKIRSRFDGFLYLTT